MSDILSRTDEGKKPKFNATEAIIEKFCRLIVGRGGQKGRQTLGFFPSAHSESLTYRVRVTIVCLQLVAVRVMLRSLPIQLYVRRTGLP